MKIALLCLFVFVLLLSGFVSMRKTRTVNDFFLGGRKVGPWLSAFAYGTTYFSAVIIVGYAGKVGWGFGLSSVWIVVGNTLIGTLLAWLVLAKRTRAMTKRLNVMTMPEFLEARYCSGRLKLFSALVIFVFLVPYSASVYIGLSYLFNQIFGIPYAYAVIFMCALTAVYLIMGGYRAVALTDLIQGLVMIVGVGVLLYFVVGSEKVGGIVNAVQGLKAIDPALAGIVGPPGPLALASLVILTSLGVWGLPQMVQKFYAIKSEASIKPAIIISTLFAFIISLGAYFTGGLSRLMFTALPVDPATGIATPDMIMPVVINTYLPEIAAALILLLVLSASMSTLASLVLVSSSAIAIDLYKTVKPKQTSGEGIFLFRLLCLIFICLSLLIALLKPAIILSLMGISWGVVAGFFLAPYLYGLFWRRATTAGAWASGLVGFSIAVFFSFYYHLDSNAIPIVASAAMLISLVVLPVVSLFTRTLPKEHVSKVFGDQENCRSNIPVVQEDMV